MSTGRPPAPMLAVVAGSGLGALADSLECGRSVPFADIEGVGACTVDGHAGEVREASAGGRACLLVLGRRHFYEGAAAAMDQLIAYLAARGATHLLVTSAAGALDRSLSPGDVVVARDLIDRQHRYGERGGVPRLRAAGRPILDRGLVCALEMAATRAQVRWQRGTLVCGSGPAYETAAEVRALQEASGHVATMSAAPEVMAANRAGLPVAVAVLVTNPGTGIAHAAPRHEEVLEAGRRSAAAVGRMVVQLISHL